MAEEAVVQDGGTTATAPSAAAVSKVGDALKRISDANAQPRTQEATPEAHGQDEGTEGKGKAAETQESDAGVFELTGRQVAAAKRLGYSDDEIAEMSESEANAIQRAAVEKDRGIAKVGNKLAEANKQIAELNAKLQEAAEKKKSSEVSVSDDDLADITEDDAIEDPGKVAKTVNAAMAQIKRLQEQFAEASKGGARNNRQTDPDEIEAEAWYSKLDGEMYPELGKGPTGRLAASAPERLARKELLAKARSFREVLAMTDEDITLDEAMERMALSSRTVEAIEQRAIEQAGEKLKQRRKQMHPRPDKGPARRSAVSPHQQSVEKLNKIFQKMRE